MLPNELDELFREKSEQFDFEYNPKNWDKLVNKLDNKPERRKIMLWLPMAGVISASSIAASLAMIIGIPSLFHHKAKAPVAQVAMSAPAAPSASAVISNTPVTSSHKAVSAPSNTSKSAISYTARAKQVARAYNNSSEKTIAMSLSPKAQVSFYKKPAIAEDQATAKVYGTFAESGNSPKTKIEKNPYYQKAHIYNTFRNGDEDPVKMNARTMLSIAGGYNYGSSSNGYSIGATGKRMIGSKFFVEGDVALVNSTVGQSYSSSSTVITNGGNGNLASNNSANSSTSTPTVDGSTGLGLKSKLSFLSKQLEDVPTPTPTKTAVTTTVENHINYNSYYAQVAPMVGYHLMKNISVGVGADVQSLITDNRSSSSNADAIKGSPNVDLGLIGKTECAISKKVKAGIYYRKGMNNTLDPGGKYVERSYVQLQLKYTILGK